MILRKLIFSLIVIAAVTLLLGLSRQYLPSPNGNLSNKISVFDTQIHRIAQNLWEIKGNIINRDRLSRNVELRVLAYGLDNSVVGVIKGVVMNVPPRGVKNFRFYTSGDLSPQVRHTIEIESID